MPAHQAGTPPANPPGRRRDALPDTTHNREETTGNEPEREPLPDDAPQIPAPRRPLDDEPPAEPAEGERGPIDPTLSALARAAWAEMPPMTPDDIAAAALVLHDIATRLHEHD